jgi:hypothetical protein
MMLESRIQRKYFLHLIYLITLNIRENQSNQVQRKISEGILAPGFCR